MKGKLISSALFNFRNLSVLILSGGAAFLAGGAIDQSQIVAYPAAAALYLAFVIQSLASTKFHEEFNHKRKKREIQDLNYTCLKLANQAKKQVNSMFLPRLRKVVEDKNEIVNSFFRGERSYLKEKIVEQTLHLVISYIKLLTNYCLRSKELGSSDVGELANRINVNHRKLNFVKNPHAADDLKKVIEMDERIITRLKDEKNELERLSAKLDYMESTISMFKHQIIANIETEEMAERLETVVNEAVALDSVLDERQKSRARMR
jgi:hypothetical protein